MQRSPLQLAGMYAAVAAMLVVFIGPIGWLVSVSLQTRSSLFGTGALAHFELTLENYETVLTSGNFLRALGNSIVIGLGTVALSLFAGVPAAFTLSFVRFRGRASFLTALVVIRMLPAIALLIPLYVIFRVSGLLNTRLAIILAYSSFCLPLVVWIMKNFFDDVPRELEESAVVDGAGRLTAFAAIILPLVRPGLVAVAIITLLTAWNEFLLAVVLTNNDTLTLPVIMATYSSDSGIRWGELAAAGIMVTLPVIVFSFVVQRHLVSGLSAGALKG